MSYYYWIINKYNRATTCMCSIMVYTCSKAVVLDVVKHVLRNVYRCPSRITHSPETGQISRALIQS